MTSSTSQASAARLRASAVRHGLAALFFALFALTWTFPLVRRLTTHLPGAVLGDNVGFLWNFWWMREALATGTTFFHTTYLFAPTGADLTLHTHTALLALAGATVFGDLPVTTAHNVVILIASFLNAFCAYLLAWRVTQSFGAALVAGLVFGGSPYFAAHLNGHFNLTTMWTIPLFALAMGEALRGSVKWAILGGLVLGMTTFIDYYYVVFEIALATLMAASGAREWSLTRRPAGRLARRLALIVLILIAIDVLLILAILLTGGISVPIGPVQSARSVFNPLQGFWLLLFAWLFLRVQPRLISGVVDAHAARRSWRALVIVGGVFAIVALPILWNVAILLARGDYVTQQYFWRSAPRGVDAATLFMGNPFHPVWGSAVLRAYERFGIDAIETTAWFGVVPLLFAIWIARTRIRSSQAVRLWVVVGSVFFVWALGPHLVVFGQNTGMILPQALLRYVPLVNNARIPGRAIAVAYLAVAMLLAIALAEWRSTGRRRGIALVAIGLAIAADYLPAPFPLAAVERPAIYDALAARTETGVLCELPMGLRDGFGERGDFDERALFYQTIHERPIVGGYISRIPRAVTTAYDGDPLLAALLQLSSPDQSPLPTPPPDSDLAATCLQKQGIQFVLLNRETASPALADYVERVLPLTLIAESEGRALYVVRARVAP